VTKLKSLPPRRRRAPLSRSEQMGRIRGKDTKPELIVRAMVHSLGCRFRLHAGDLPGKPDLVNRKGRWAIFVHGCFWHSHEGCRLASKPRSNQTYWSGKLDRNRDRDQANLAALVDAGFNVLTVWECEVKDREVASGILTGFFASLPATDNVRD
jgi:DNA mismatch endonuclease, patch repair protein